MVLFLYYYRVKIKDGRNEGQDLDNFDKGENFHVENKIVYIAGKTTGHEAVANFGQFFVVDFYLRTHSKKIFLFEKAGLQCHLTLCCTSSGFRILI